MRKYLEGNHAIIQIAITHLLDEMELNPTVTYFMFCVGVRLTISIENARTFMSMLKHV